MSRVLVVVLLVFSLAVGAAPTASSSITGDCNSQVLLGRTYTVCLTVTGPQDAIVLCAVATTDAGTSFVIVTLNAEGVMATGPTLQNPTNFDEISIKPVFGAPYGLSDSYSVSACTSPRDMTGVTGFVHAEAAAVFLPGKTLTPAIVGPVVDCSPLMLLGDPLFASACHDF